MGIDLTISRDALSFSEDEINGSIPDRFARVVSAFPDHVAVISTDSSLTYRELGRAAERVAFTLRTRLGDAPEAVALLLSNGISTAIGLMGVIKAGKFYCALNPDDPINRSKAILADLKARLLISDDPFHDLANQAAPDGCAVAVLNDLETGALGGDLPDLNLHGSSQTGVYYTSGSTGEPKGIPRNHSGMLYRAWLDSNFFGIKPGDRLIMLRPFMFSGSSGDIFSSILTGASLCLYDVKRLGIASLSAYMKRKEITIFRPPIELLRYFLDSLDRNDFFPSIRCLVLSGDVLYKKDVDQIRQHFPREATIIHHLAASETGVLARLVISPDMVIESDVVPVGYPVPGKEILIIDENGQKMGFDQVGQIAVRSKLITPDADDTPDMQEHHFIPDPDNPGQSVYLTDDLGRMQKDGLLEFVGRKDFQLKIRGFRVNTTAIVSRLMDIEGINHAAISARADPSGEKRLVAYLTIIPGANLSLEGIRAALVQSLPDYMLPSALVVLDRFPLTPNGKINHNALPEPDWRHPVVEIEVLTPRDDIEKRLVNIWQKVLGVEQVGIRDDFFALGGHSLLAASLFVQIQKDFGRKLFPAILIENNTVERLAGILKQQNAQPQLIVPIQAGDNKQPLFLAPGNAGDTLYLRTLAAHLGPDQPAYGLQVTDLGDSLPALTNLETMAAHYLREIYRIQPSGPYYLAGHSFGGRLAFAIAQLLTQAGKEVAMLVLVDTFAPGQHPRATLSERIMLHVNNLRALPAREWTEYFHQRLISTIVQLSRHRSFRLILERAGYIPPDASSKNRIAARAYVYQPYPGKLIFFRAKDRPAYVRTDLTAGWRDFATELEIHDVPGDHGNLLLEPNVSGLAEELKKCLQEAQLDQIAKHG